MPDEQITEAATISALTIVDSSRISTFIISILLIVYGSFRSLNIEREKEKDEKDKEKFGLSLPGGGSSDSESQTMTRETYQGNTFFLFTELQTLDTCQAMFLPVGASISLLIMFLFFDSLQVVFAVFTAILATVAFAFLLLPMCQYFVQPCSSGQKISFGVCGRFTAAEIISFCLSFTIVCIWILTGHWLLMDALGMGLCVAFIALVRLPSLKVSTLLLLGLLVYDVFWVFFSSYIFSTNVMVKVATRPADNPVGLFAKKLHLTGLVRDAPKLSLPAKLVFPSSQNSSHFNMLGLGDIVMPGLLLCFVLRYDTYKKSQTCSAETGVPPPPNYVQRLSYFHCSLIGYFLGLLTATVSSEVFKAAQPALLYLVPFTLLPLLTMAYLKGDLRRMWHEPFLAVPVPKHMEV
ncbi:signal peptide peptidase-like 3 isoform X3 [Physella acuta]|nr:signal peptide peptidase-like 3 isoform X3 [Physella acuta]